MKTSLKIRHFLLLVGFFVVMIASAQAFFWNSKSDKADADAVAVLEIGWEDLIPEGFRPMANPLDNMTAEQLNKLFDDSEESNKELAEIEEMMAFAPVVDALDGKRVKLPGYVVALDYDGQTLLEEFLLVPYFGACIHTPPPPANQVVHALADDPVEIEDTYQPVWAIGTMIAETKFSNLAESGYQLKIERIEPYDI